MRIRILLLRVGDAEGEEREAQDLERSKVVGSGEERAAPCSR